MLLYADPEADEAVAGYLNADEGVLELRHHALGLKTLDLFRRDPTGLWDSLRSTDTLNVGDFLQADSSAGEDYCRICFDAEADKIYLVSAPEVDYIDAMGVVKYVSTTERRWRQRTTPCRTTPALICSPSSARTAARR